MVRVTLTVDERLLETARKLCGARTKRETVDIALRELVRRLGCRQIVSHAGKVELDLTQSELQRLREGR